MVEKTKDAMQTRKVLETHLKVFSTIMGHHGWLIQKFNCFRYCMKDNTENIMSI